MRDAQRILGLVGTDMNRDKGPDESSPEGPKAEGGGQAGFGGRWEERIFDKSPLHSS